MPGNLKNAVHIVYLMNGAYFLLIDMGRIQERIHSLGQYVSFMPDIMRDQKPVQAGTVGLVTMDTENIVCNQIYLFDYLQEYRSKLLPHDLYVDDFASLKSYKIFQS